MSDIYPKLGVTNPDRFLEVEEEVVSELSGSDRPVGPSTRFLIRSTNIARLLVDSLGEVAGMSCKCEIFAPYVLARIKFPDRNIK